MFKNEGGGGVKGRLNNVKKTDDLVLGVVPKRPLCMCENELNEKQQKNLNVNSEKGWLQICLGKPEADLFPTAAQSPDIAKPLKSCKDQVLGTM